MAQNDIVGQNDTSSLQTKLCYLRLFYLFTYVPEVTYSCFFHGSGECIAGEILQIFKKISKHLDLLFVFHDLACI